MKIAGGFVIYRASGDIFRKFHGVRGFSLLELLVVIGVISILSAILLPSLNKARLQARRLVGRSNKRQIAQSANLYTLDNDDHYPESVATIGVSGNWNWTEPMLIIGKNYRSPGYYLSMSSYLSGYIVNPEILSCPSAPDRTEYLEEAWNAGEHWDNPDTLVSQQDPLSGNYSFYWNYTGYLKDRDSFFRGPRTSAGGRGESKLLVSDYFGYDHWRSLNAFGSCERFKKADVTPGTAVSSSYWSRSEDEVSLNTIDVKLQAAFTDEHVEDYTARNVVGMRAIRNVQTGEPYPDDLDMGPGVLYLPGSALY